MMRNPQNEEQAMPTGFFDIPLHLRREPPWRLTVPAANAAPPSNASASLTANAPVVAGNQVYSHGTVDHRHLR